MSRKTRTPEEQPRREKIRALPQESNVTSMEDIQNLFKETIAEFMENGLESELDESLGYGKYDYKNKETDTARRIFVPALAMWRFPSHATERVSLSLSSSRRTRPVSARTLKKRYFLCMQKA